MSRSARSSGGRLVSIHGNACCAAVAAGLNTIAPLISTTVRPPPETRRDTPLARLATRPTPGQQCIEAPLYLVGADSAATSLSSAPNLPRVPTPCQHVSSGADATTGA